MSDIIQITEEDRFDRFRLISWWDQKRLAAAKVLVIGAGALGNEIIKNLALLGVGNVFVVDRDAIEGSNLSRSVLFRAEDCGKLKADVAVAAGKTIYPGLHARAFNGNVVYDVGVGIFRWADVIIGGLDNREARVAINRNAARAGKVWIDGAIERLDGVARVFDPAKGPCYECTMSDIDWKMLERRRSCALLSRQDMAEGKVPTTPTTASVVAGVQCQEAVKLLHGLETLAGQGYVFNGMMHESYVVKYKRLPECPSHEADEPVEVLDASSNEMTVGQMLERVRRDVGEDAVLEFSQDLLAALSCEKCGTREDFRANLGQVSEQQARCGKCGEHRTPEVFHTMDGSEDFLDRPLRQIGVPPWDVLAGRSGMKQRFYEMRGDAPEILGELAPTLAAGVETK